MNEVNTSTFVNLEEFLGLNGPTKELYRRKL